VITTTQAQTVHPTTPTTRGQAVVTTHGPEVSTNKAVSCDGKPGLFTKDATDAHKFHECVNGVLVTFTCPEHLIFSEAKQNCDFESGPVTNPSDNSKSTSSPSSHSCPQPNGFFRDPQNAHKFIECVDGTAYSFTCPDNLVFDEKTKVCTYDDKATTSSGPVTTHGVSPDCVGKTGFFKDPSDKHKFFDCNNGVKESYTCPENLVFDVALGRCAFETTGNPTTSHITPTAGPTEHPQTEGTRPRHTNPSY